MLYAGQGQFRKAKNILEESLRPGGESAGLPDSSYPDVDSLQK